MSFRRARTVYYKELIDILRDRRTLAAMIIAPIVLYPLLMLGGIQAASSQTRGIADERIVVGFEQEWQWEAVVKPILMEERALLQQQRAEAEARGADAAELDAIPEPLAEYIDPQSSAQLEESIRQQRIHCGVVVDRRPGDGSANVGDQVTLTLVTQRDQVRSEIAAQRLKEAFERVGTHRRDIKLRILNIDPRIVEPIVIRFRNLVTPGSILGLILPFILVLMTVTGAIYPAIDLTAGERERGTLESLIVCPVPVIDLIVGKFMAVTTIAIIAAALNIASVTATVYFGGLQEALALDAEPSNEQGFPFWAFPVVLFTLIPFAVLMSAIMIAVCACARTFKEAQNYIMPVIMLVLVPGGIAALPGTRLEGVMVVTPVANMVLLTRDLLSGATITGSTFAWVLLSTSFYAAVAVAVAAQVFGKESVLFADSLSFRAMVSRRLIKPSRRPTLSGAGLYAAFLFPVWFYVQSALQRASEDDMSGVLRWTAALMPVFFLMIPFAASRYWKIDARETFRLSLPRPRYWLAAVLIGVSAWAPAHELFVFQERYIATPPALADSNRALNAALTSMPVGLAFLVIAVVPAVCEECFFRGFLLSGLRSAFRTWPAVLFAAATFGAFHFFIFRFPVTMALGVLLGWLCWRSGSIWPAVTMHALHNGLAVALVYWPVCQEWVGLSATDPWAHLPIQTLGCAGGLLVVAWLLVRRPASAGRKG